NYNTHNEIVYVISGLVKNSLEAEITHESHSKTSIKEKLIFDLVNKCQYYNLDGINLDFQNINIEDKDLYVQFIRELYPVFNEKGLILYVVVTTIFISVNWSNSFVRSSFVERVNIV